MGVWLGSRAGVVDLGAAEGGRERMRVIDVKQKLKGGGAAAAAAAEVACAAAAAVPV